MTILELAKSIQLKVGYSGALRFDETKPEGTPRKLLDVTKLNALGWHAKIDLNEGIEKTLSWYRDNVHRLRH